MEKSRVKKICFYSPYLGKHFGGGDKYILSCASFLSQHENYQVYLAINPIYDFKKVSLNKYQKKFNLDLSKIKVVPLKTNPLTKLVWTRQFDVFYLLTDGSLFFTLTPNRICHFQIPFQFPPSGLINRIKLQHWNIKNSNSKFTKKVIENYWQTNINCVHYPIIIETQKKDNVFGIKTKQDLKEIQTKKEHLILTVGRIFKKPHNKRHDILIKNFIELKNKGQIAPDWNFCIVGSIEDKDLYQELTDLIKGRKDIDIKTNVSYRELLDLYKRASIYWHATGFGTDEDKNPDAVEHFGMSVVEAMSFAALPVVIYKGGIKEIVTQPALQNLTWTKADELKNKTITATSLNLNMNLIEDLKTCLQPFSKNNFKQKLINMVENKL